MAGVTSGLLSRRPFFYKLPNDTRLIKTLQAFLLLFKLFLLFYRNPGLGVFYCFVHLHKFSSWIGTALPLVAQVSCLRPCRPIVYETKRPYTITNRVFRTILFRFYCWYLTIQSLRSQLRHRLMVQLDCLIRLRTIIVFHWTGHHIWQHTFHHKFEIPTQQQQKQYYDASYCIKHLRSTTPTTLQNYYYIISIGGK